MAWPTPPPSAHPLAPPPWHYSNPSSLHSQTPLSSSVLSSVLPRPRPAQKQSSRILFTRSCSLDPQSACKEPQKTEDEEDLFSTRLLLQIPRHNRHRNMCLRSICISFSLYPSIPPCVFLALSWRALFFARIRVYKVSSYLGWMDGYQWWANQVYPQSYETSVLGGFRKLPTTTPPVIRAGKIFGNCF